MVSFDREAEPQGPVIVMFFSCGEHDVDPFFTGKCLDRKYFGFETSFLGRPVLPLQRSHYTLHWVKALRPIGRKAV